MRAGLYQLVIEQGATLDLAFQYTDSDGHPVDLTGMTLRCMGRARYDSASTLFDWDTAGGEIVITDAVNGRFQFDVPATETASLDFSDGVYDVELVDGADVQRLLMGQVILSLEATR